MSITDKSTIFYRHNMPIDQQDTCIEIWNNRTVYEAKCEKISARSLRSLVIIYEISQVSYTLLIRLAIS